tara:strand:- start:366 stop:566 length:201 start_codon:yes stop_codon:yes gene_type:complete
MYYILITIGVNNMKLKPISNENISKVKSFKIYTDDTDEGKVLVGNDIDTALEILENNGYIIEVEYY